MPGDVKITVLPGISGQVIEGTILDPSTPPRMSHGIHGPLPHPSPVLPPSTPKGLPGVAHCTMKQVKWKRGMDSVAIHSRRGVCRDGL